MRKWGHNELQHDLAEHLSGQGDKVVWENMQMGPSGSARPDVYVLPKSYTKFRPMTYEIKVSVSDFRSDITTGKWQSYLEFSCGVIFAVPAGLISKEDVPKGCGLIVRHEDIWRTAKAPTLQLVQSLPHDCWMKLMIDGIARQSTQDKQRVLNEYHAQADIRRKYGDRIADLLSDLSSAEYRIQREVEEARNKATRIREDGDRQVAEIKRQLSERAEPEIAKLFEVLGLPRDATPFDVSWRCREIMQRLDKDEEIKRLKSQLNNVERALRQAKEPFPLTLPEEALL